MDVGQSIHWAESCSPRDRRDQRLSDADDERRHVEGQARGGGGSGANVGPGRMSVDGLSSTAAVRETVDTMLLPASGVLTSHAVMAEQWPGASGTPHRRLACVSPQLPWLVELSSPGVTESDLSTIAVALVPLMLRIAPTTRWVSPLCVVHNEPLPVRMSWKRKRPESAANARRTRDIGVTECKALAKGRPANSLTQSGEANVSVSVSPMPSNSGRSTR